jgi:hypothetical protein
MRSLLEGLALTLALGLGGCTPSIGDKCVLSTDCSLQGDRLCDTSEPGGYCTVLNCASNSCPNSAVCVMFNAAVPGCAYNDRSLSRTGRTFCMAQCQSNSDCRDGYICANPLEPPWNALIIDNNQMQLVCIVPPDVGATGADASTPLQSDAAVCQASGPPVPPLSLDGSLSEDAAVDSAADAADAADANDSAVDAASEGAPDGGSDASDASDAADSSG